MHLLIIIIAVAFLAKLQVSSYKENKKRIGKLVLVFQNFKCKLKTFYIPSNKIKTIEASQIFSHEKSYLSSEFTDDEDPSAPVIPVNLIVANKGSNEILLEIIENIDNYLLRNHNAAGDFNLMKDVVERTCERIEDEIEAELPIPLYLGLTGTMIGIIVGIGYIGLFGGGFSAFVENPTESIGSLMGGVALAMVASLIGISMTTRCTWLNRNAKANFEQNKNHFYNWLQTELLPTVSETVASTLGMMQRNLTKFNDAFADNVKRIDGTLGSVVHSLSDQTELLNVLNEIDIEKFSTANIDVLKQLKASFDQFDKFNSYISSVNICMARVQSTTNSIERLYNRTQALEEVSEYFKKESQAINERKKAIATAMENVDDALQKSLNEIVSSAKSSTKRISNEIDSQLKTCCERLCDMNKAMETAMNRYGELATTMTVMQKELAQMSSVKDAIINQEHTIGDLVKAVRDFKQAASNWQKNENHIISPDLSHKEESLFSICWKCLIFVMGLLLFLKYYFSIDLVSMFH